jgi:hypothetical protein
LGWVSDDNLLRLFQDDMFIRTLLPLVALALAVIVSPAVPSAASDGEAPEKIKVTHRPAEGDWSVVETANFRLYHRGGRAFAERLIRVAEGTRTLLLERWFGESKRDWDAPCELYLYGDPREYSEATGAPPQSPAHTRIDGDSDRVLARRIHLHSPTADTLRAVLPHEVTHAVLAGRFGRRIPRWADEGMAVLTEPAERIAGHLRSLPHWRDEGLLFSPRDLFELEDYPPPRAWGSFYAESVSLVQFLSKEKGPQTFARFLRDGLKDGYSPALRRHYGWSFAELDRRWRRQAFTEDTDAAP